MLRARGPHDQRVAAVIRRHPRPVRPAQRRLTLAIPGHGPRAQQIGKDRCNLGRRPILQVIGRQIHPVPRPRLVQFADPAHRPVQISRARRNHEDRPQPLIRHELHDTPQRAAILGLEQGLRLLHHRLRLARGQPHQRHRFPRQDIHVKDVQRIQRAFCHFGRPGQQQDVAPRIRHHVQPGVNLRLQQVHHFRSRHILQRRHDDRRPAAPPLPRQTEARRSRNPRHDLHRVAGFPHLRPVRAKRGIEQVQQHLARDGARGLDRDAPLQPVRHDILQPQRIRQHGLRRRRDRCVHKADFHIAATRRPDLGARCAVLHRLGVKEHVRPALRRNTVAIRRKPEAGPTARHAATAPAIRPECARAPPPVGLDAARQNKRQCGANGKSDSLEGHGGSL